MSRGFVEEKKSEHAMKRKEGYVLRSEKKETVKKPKLRTLSEYEDIEFQIRSLSKNKYMEKKVEKV